MSFAKSTAPVSRQVPLCHRNGLFSDLARMNQEFD